MINIHDILLCFIVAIHDYYPKTLLPSLLILSELSYRLVKSIKAFISCDYSLKILESTPLCQHQKSASE
jgi:hypothetical protein